MKTEAEHEKDGKPLPIQKEVIKDETGNIEIVLFSSLIDEVSSNTSYDFTKMRVQKFMNETTKVSKNDVVAFCYEKSVKAKVVSTDLKTLTQIYLYPVCSAPLSINNAVAWCKECNNVSSQSQCKSIADMKMVILDESGQLGSTIDVLLKKYYLGVVTHQM